MTSVLGRGAREAVSREEIAGFSEECNGGLLS